MSNAPSLRSARHHLSTALYLVPHCSYSAQSVSAHAVRVLGHLGLSVYILASTTAHEYRNIGALEEAQA